MTARRLGLAPLVVLLAAPPSALGSSSKPRTVAPTFAERAAILRAFGDPPTASPCLAPRLAASNRDYATVRFRTTKACRRWAFNGTNIFKRGKDDHWRLVGGGSAYHCPLPRIPAQVQRDLSVCPHP